MFPLDMTTKHDQHLMTPHDEDKTTQEQDTSPPPLTKLVHRKPSSPREFFEKLYGPDPRSDERSSSPEIDVEKPDRDTLLNINNNTGYNMSLHHGMATPSYLPAFPLPPHEVGLVNLENVPFPGGLAAFRKFE